MRSLLCGHCLRRDRRGRPVSRGAASGWTRSATLTRVAEDIRLEPVSADGVPAEWSFAPGAEASRVLLYLHGGGFCAGSIVSHRAMVTEAGRAAQARTLAIDYRRRRSIRFRRRLTMRFRPIDGCSRKGCSLGGSRSAAIAPVAD